MATIQQSIEVNVPVRTAYNQLTQFEAYPQFMQDVDAVHQLDDTHLHWSTRMPHQNIEWDAEITEQLPDRCIAWRSVSDINSAGRVELQSVGQERALVTLTVECEPSQIVPPQEGNPETFIAQRLEQDLASFKEFMEARGSESGEWRGEVHGAHVTMRDRDTHGQTSGDTMGKTIGQTASEQQDADRSGIAERNDANQPVQTSSYAAGSEGWDGSEDVTQPVRSSSRSTQNSNEAPMQQPVQASLAFGLQAEETMQSANSLSHSSDDQAEDGRFSVAEEVNFDQQSDEARRIGQMPEKAAGGSLNGSNAPDAIAKSMMSDAADTAKLAQKDERNQSIERAVPRSDDNSPSKNQ